ncbi:hypothetical protein [Vibrio vulnificus YJ016]|uniref:Uncharacterized protein n=1 Tax=Vibrio vulnificus (strain YJ016) TaxID=196600 RepID=Q7MHK9_VIBVY|nr:hypothetical protein [Vibrio vulnificus YJ016]
MRCFFIASLAKVSSGKTRHTRFLLVIKQGAKVPSEIRDVSIQYIGEMNVSGSEKRVYRD